VGFPTTHSFVQAPVGLPEGDERSRARSERTPVGALSSGPIGEREGVDARGPSVLGFEIGNECGVEFEVGFPVTVQPGQIGG
jgi:hypothetical protein